MNEEKYIKLSLNDLNTIIHQSSHVSADKTLPFSATNVSATNVHATSAPATNVPATVHHLSAHQQLWQSLITSMASFIVLITIIMITKPGVLFDETHLHSFKPIMVGNSKITLYYFIIIIAIVCCCVSY